MRNAGNPGQALEQTMTIMTFGPIALTMQNSTPLPAFKLSATVTTKPALPQDIDRDEQRWQLEWERRNVED